MAKGGVLGIGGEDIAVPLEAFSFSAETNKATLVVDKSMLDNAPQKADLSDAEFQRELQSHYGVSPAWKKEREMMQETPQEMMQEKGQEMMNESSRKMKEMEEQKKKSMY